MGNMRGGKILVVVLFTAIGVFAYRKLTADWPVVQAAEIHATNTQQAPPIQHRELDALLRDVVKDGLVDYAALRERVAELDAYLATLEDIVPTAHCRNELLALYINAYNAATLRLIVDYYPGIDSIRDIPDLKRWKAVRWRIAGRMLSLDHLEHRVLRAEFDEPRIHFAVVCASKGCPPLRAEAYRPEALEDQLTAQTRAVHADARFVQWDTATRTLRVTRIYEWFETDFERQGQTRQAFIARHMPAPAAADITGGPAPTIAYLDWDWTLNAQ